MSVNIRKYAKKDGTVSWYVAVRAGGKQKYIREKGLLALGLDPDLTYEQAKERIATLNAQEQLTRTVESRVKIAERFEKERLENLAFLPPGDIDEFERKVIAPKFMGVAAVDPRHKIMTKWRASLRAMAAVKLDPSDWYDQPFLFYNYFVQQKFSPNYIERIIGLMNLYGRFYCKKYSKAFLPLEKLKGKLKHRQANAYQTKHRKGIKSDPLTPSQLEGQRGNLSVEQYNWLLISVWMGLRPEEIDRLKIRDHEHAYFVSKVKGTPVLHVYQSKLVEAVDEDSRWKMIPLFCKEQREALKVIDSGLFKRPLTKTLKKYFTARTTTYCGRKGFTRLMKGFEQAVEDIAQWLGHSSIDRTYADYMDKKTVSFKKVA